MMILLPPPRDSLVSGILQLVVMPWAMVRVNPSLLLKTLPIVAGSGFLVTFVSPGFRTATVAFSVTKILEYSVRCVNGEKGTWESR